MRESIIQVALSQVGTVENGPNCVRYNLEMWGKNGMPWCATFVSWCARQAGISQAYLSYTASASGMAAWFMKNGKFRKSAAQSLQSYTPQAGDTIYFSHNFSSGHISHVGLVAGHDSEYIYTIEGNYSNAVKKCKYKINNSTIVGFGILDGMGTMVNYNFNNLNESYGNTVGFVGNMYQQPINITVNAPTYQHNYGKLTGTDIYYRNIEEAQIIGKKVITEETRDKSGKVITQQKEIDIYEYKLPEDNVPEAQDWGIAQYDYPEIKLDDKLFSLVKEEKISGIKLNANGSYVKSEPKDYNKVLEAFFHYDQIVDLIHNTQLQVKEDNTNLQKNKVSNNKEGVISALVKTKNAFDRFGRTIKEGSTCRICHKRLAYLPAQGFCSTECFIKDLTNRVLVQRATSENDPVNVTVDYLQHWLQYINIVINLITELPQLLRDVRWLPDIYRNYVVVKLNICFVKIRLMITRLLLAKNDAIIRLLTPVQNGVLDDKLAFWFEPINNVIKLINIITKALNTAMAAAIKAMQIPTSTIAPESYAWLMTPRSALNSDAGKLFVELPTTSPTKGIVTKIIPTGVLNQHVEAIDKWVHKKFPPITNAEYLLDPDAFNLRLELSDQSDIVRRTYEILANFMVLGPDYMPRYKNLKLTNFYFITAILEGWAIHGKNSFGSLIHPNI